MATQIFDYRIRRVSFAAAVLAFALVAAPHSAQQLPAAGQQQSPSGLLIPQQPPPAPSPLLQNYKPITAERLKKPEDGNWLMVRRTYDGWGYSPLEQINTAQTAAGATRVATTNRMYSAPGAEHLSEVLPWNVDTGKKIWTHHFATSPNWRPIMTTGGGLVFSGGTNDRMFRAFNASTGEVLWEFPTNPGIYAPASSFMIEGK